MNSFNNLLAIETSSEKRSMALLCSKGIIRSTVCNTAEVDGEARHGPPTAALQKANSHKPGYSNYMQELDLLLKKGGLSGADKLDAIGVSVGPGSFTGIRVGLAIAKGIALPLQIPIIGYSSSELLAYGLGVKNRTIHTLTICRRNEFYSAGFAAGKTGELSCVRPDETVNIDQLLEISAPDAIFVGSYLYKYKDQVAAAVQERLITFIDSEMLHFPDAAVMLGLMEKSCSKMILTNRGNSSIVPLYIQRSEFTKNPVTHIGSS